MGEKVTVCEVGPRDGLQMAHGQMPTATKIRWIQAIAAAGVPEIEVGSFVPARVIPQMADTGEVVRALAQSRPTPAGSADAGFLVIALAPNLRGAQDAVAAGAGRISVPVSVSLGHSRANLNRTPMEQVAEVRRIVDFVHGTAPGVAVEAACSTAFGCSIDGRVDERDVVAVAAALAEAGVDTLALADTVGYANPAQIRATVRAVRAEVGRVFDGLHLHDTMGLGLANALAGLEEGVRAFDASLAGLGGCPYAPGASGNIVTEDLVFLLESIGFETGIDLDRLVASRDVLAEGLPDEPRRGAVARAGLPRTFHYARPRRGMTDGPMPLAGVRVIEFAHMVMGPTCGLILADLGADVIKVEPLEGDNTRRLTGSGTGFFAMMNRNKRSFAVDLKSAEGMASVRALLGTADVLVENFRPGALDKLGLGPGAVAALNPRLVYASCKGFLPGPYAHRTALDEVVQMMGGLAYMTGPPGQPLRAGSSVIDIMGGTFAAVGVLAALEERHRTGRGRHVQSGLFESVATLMAQHMAQTAISGTPPPPMSVRLPAWPVYDIFDTSDGGQVFLGVVTDTQWQVFCRHFGFDAWLDDPALATQALRLTARERTIPAIAAVLGAMTRAALMAAFEALGLPFAPIGQPAELFDDPHLNGSGGLVPVTLPDGRATKLPALPISLDGARLPLRRGLPAVGEHTAEILREIPPGG